MAGEEVVMLKLALAFFILALLAAVFGYGGISASAGAVLQILFWAFVILAVVSLLTGLTFKRRPST
jgi:uncharacterized membrane protein YtjA (UPF0391 family)